MELKDRTQGITKEKIATLGEVLLLVKGQCKVLVEMKCSRHKIGFRNVYYPKMSELLLEELQRHTDWESWVWVQSFHDRYLHECRKLHSGVVLHKLALIYRNTLFGPFFVDMDGMYGSSLVNAQSVKQCKVASVNLHHSSITTELVKLLHAAGLTIFAWTVDDVAVARKLEDMGVDGIISNCPRLMREEKK